MSAARITARNLQRKLFALALLEHSRATQVPYVEKKLEKMDVSTASQDDFLQEQYECKSLHSIDERIIRAL
jgi:hypothetical protein